MRCTILNTNRRGFLWSGVRWDVDIRALLNLKSATGKRLEMFAQKHGSGEPQPGSTISRLAPLPSSNAAFRDWSTVLGSMAGVERNIVWCDRCRRFTVVMAVHQNHDYGYLPRVVRES